MTDFAIASHFDDGRLFFTGAIDLGNPLVLPARCFVPQTTSNRDDAFRVDTIQAARALATSLTELSGLLPPKQPRTWFIVDLPMERRP
jgi:hypothetical protein